MGISARQRKFLRAFIAHGGSKMEAGKETGVPKSTYARWFKDDEEFRIWAEELFDDLECELRQEAVRRAKAGSDVLLIFLLKACNPRRYCDATRRQLFVQREQEREVPPVPALYILPSDHPPPMPEGIRRALGGEWDETGH